MAWGSLATDAVDAAKAAELDRGVSVGIPAWPDWVPSELVALTD